MLSTINIIYNYYINILFINHHYPLIITINMNHSTTSMWEWSSIKKTSSPGTLYVNFSVDVHGNSIWLYSYWIPIRILIEIWKSSQKNPKSGFLHHNNYNSLTKPNGVVSFIHSSQVTANDWLQYLVQPDPLNRKLDTGRVESSGWPLAI